MVTHYYLSFLIALGALLLIGPQNVFAQDKEKKEIEAEAQPNSITSTKGQSNEKADNEDNDSPRLVTGYGIDPYYTYFELIYNFSGKGIRDVGQKSEFEIIFINN